MSELTDDRSPLERRIGSALALPSAPLLTSTVSIERQHILALVAERLSEAPDQGRPHGARRLAFGGAAVGILAAVVVAVALVPGLLRPGLTVRHFAMSWAYHYGSVRAIGAASPLVVVGSVDAVTRTGPDPQTAGVPQTTFTVTVERTLKGTAPGQSISVVQSGGQVGTVLYEAEGDPLLPVGGHVVLFLRPLSDVGPTTYAMVGGPEGHLTLQGDRLVAASPEGLTLPADLTVDQLAADLRS